VRQVFAKNILHLEGRLSKFEVKHPKYFVWKWLHSTSTHMHAHIYTSLCQRIVRYALSGTCICTYKWYLWSITKELLFMETLVCILKELLGSWRH